jgi:uncharacterized phage-associated protein
MITAHDGRAIANFVLDLCDVRGRAITNLALQKIVYFCHVWSLIELNRPLIRHQFEAWEFGPVLPYLYREFKSYDCKPITGRATQIDSADGERRVVPYNFDPETDSLLRKIADFYTRLRPHDLVDLSHAQGGPWHTVWNHKGTVNPGMKIDDATIMEFYSKLSPLSVQ